ncbi:MAG: hypothetical protein CME62_15445 [Halobacteriovoraceae bacterium]|nr:hypothetical protein [Halobacteriovoraceae bacterium]|tara:strand:- start:3830 stop:7729 length:3900 start_codon:yes stop_codon:yes gene_type:complete
MKTVLSNLSLLSCLLLLSCGSPQGTSKLKVSIGAITANTSFPGGLFVTGSNDKGDTFSVSVPNDNDLELELANGTWNIGVLGYDGTQPYTGKPFCAHKQGLVLSGNDIDLSFDASKSTCLEYTDPQSLISGTSIAPLKLFSCMGLKKHFDLGESITNEDAPSFDCQGGGDGGGAGAGGYQSFKIAVGTKTPSGTLGKAGASSCIGLGNTGNTSSIEFPVNSGISLHVTAYSGTGCTGSTKAYFFNKGLSFNALNNLGQAAVDVGNSVNVYLHADRCNQAQQLASPFASTSSSGDYHLICHPNQFVNIGTSGTSNHTFEIGRDLDFSQVTNPTGADSYTQTIFAGNLRGNFRTVKNGNKALFNRIEGNSNDSIYISNLIIDNFDINASGHASPEYGIFTNSIYNFAGKNNIEFGGIYLLPTNELSVNASPGDKVGAFAGRVFHDDIDSRTELRNIHSMATVASNSTSIDTFTGGLVGSISDQTGYGNVRVEYSSVGRIKIPAFDFIDVIFSGIDVEGKVSISGLNNVGGLIGASDSVTVEGNYIDVELNAHSEVGGVVGSVTSPANFYSRIESSFASTKIVPTGSGPFDSLGGMVGKFEQSGSNLSFDINSSVVFLDLQAPTETINNVGGVVGHYLTPYRAELFISNTKAVNDISADGDYYGGLVGYYDTAVGWSQIDLLAGEKPAISNSIAQGYIGADGNDGFYRGGLIGKGIDADIYRSIAWTKIFGSQLLGGAYGYANNSVVHESLIDANVESNSSVTFAGGVAGEVSFTTSGGLDFFRWSKVDASVGSSSTIGADCFAGKCGLIAGNLAIGTALTSNLTYDSIAVGSIYENSSTDLGTPNLCGHSDSNFGNPCVGGSEYQSATTFTTDASCGVFSFAPFVEDGGVCVPLFEKQWAKFGRFNNTDGYLAGNNIEPFEIANTTDWNNISADSFLMAKSFELTNHLDFGDSDANINAIGSDSEPFKGALFSNGYRLLNVRVNATASKRGVFNVIDSGAVIGTEDEPLKVRDFILDCGNESNCGFIGRAGRDSATGDYGDVRLSTHVINAIISAGTADCVGGLVGRVATSVRMDRVRFDGRIGVSNGIGVGGFAGCVGANVSSNDVRLSIQDSAVTAKFIRGFDYVGGMIGKDSNSVGSNYVEIRNSFVVFDESNTNSGSLAIDATGGSYVSGLVGGFDMNSNSSLSFDTVYVDTSTARVPANYKHFARSIGTYDFDSNDYFSDLAIIWNNTSNATFYTSGSDTVPSHGYDIEAVSAAELAEGDGSAESFEASADGRSDWYYDGERLLKLDWMNPNYTDI